MRTVKVLDVLKVKIDGSDVRIATYIHAQKKNKGEGGGGGEEGEREGRRKGRAGLPPMA